MTALQHFALLEDPRSDHTKRYPLASLIFLTISVVVANCKHLTEIAAFAEERLKWFQGHGHSWDGLTPSHDVLNDLFKRIDLIGNQGVLRGVDGSSLPPEQGPVDRH